MKGNLCMSTHVEGFDFTENFKYKSYWRKQTTQGPLGIQQEGGKRTQSAGKLKAKYFKGVWAPQQREQVHEPIMKGLLINQKPSGVFLCHQKIPWRHLKAFFICLTEGGKKSVSSYLHGDPQRLPRRRRCPCWWYRWQGWPHGLGPGHTRKNTHFHPNLGMIKKSRGKKNWQTEKENVHYNRGWH